MKWEGGRQSSNVEDRRDGSAGTAGGGGRRIGGRGVGLGTVAIALVVFSVNLLGDRLRDWLDVRHAA